MTGVESKIYCNKLYELVNDNISDLNPDYVTTAETQDWLNAINDFDAKAYDAGTSKDVVQQSTKELESEFKNLNRGLAYLDRLMKKYDILNPSFHSLYKISRKTSDLGSRPKKDPAVNNPL